MATFLFKRFFRRPLRALRVIFPTKQSRKFHPTDCLDFQTQIWNRTTIQDLADLEIGATNRHWSRISVVLIRLDTSDDQSFRMAQALLSLVRPKTHLVGKWSTWEFVVCLLDVDRLAALELIASLEHSSFVSFRHGISFYEFPLDPKIGFSEMVEAARRDMLDEGDWQPFVC